MIYTNQTAFTEAVLALLDQNARSMSGDLGMCAYRGDFGHKCGIGWLITDEEYDYGIEGHPISHVTLPPSLRPVSMELMTEIQNIHDEYEPFQWPHQFKALAHSFDLEYPADA